MYVLDHDQQVSLIADMTMIRKDNEKSEAYYHDPSSDVIWKSHFPKANKRGRGPKILRTEPVPKQLEKWLERCLTNAELENARGLGIELSASPQKWERLMDVIESNYRRYKRKQLRTFLYHLKIEDHKSLFKEMGYTTAGVGFKKKKMDKLARRSKIIRFKRFWFFWM